MDTLTLSQWIFDALTGSGLLWLAWRALASPQLIRAIVLFVAFGLLMALAWVRLDAVDIALAEVAIGAGLTGALLLAALAKLTATLTTKDEADQQCPGTRPARSLRWLARGANVFGRRRTCVFCFLSFAQLRRIEYGGWREPGCQWRQ